METRPSDSMGNGWVMVKKIINNIVGHPVIALSVIILCTYLVYSNTFTNEFCVDDDLFILDWPLIQDPANFLQFFGPENQPKGEEGVYSPLKTCFHALNYFLWGKSPFGYHFIALLIHLTGVFFVYQISYLLIPQRTVAFLCGLLFGLHPVHVEAITFLTASIDTLGVVFLFISFYFYIRSQKEAVLSRTFYAYSIVFAFLAIFTHELTIVLPFLFLVYDICFHRQKTFLRKIILRISPYFILSIIYVGLKSLVLGSIARGTYLYGSFYLTMLVIIKAWAKYVLICFFPLKLSLNHLISPGIFSVDLQYFDPQAVLSQSVYDTQVLMSLLLTGMVIYFAIRMRKRNPLITFCISWFYICLLPVSNIVPSECYFAERYLYSGTLSFCLLLACSASWICHYHGLHQQILKRMGALLIISVVVFYSVRTIRRNADWKNEKALYESEVRANPQHPVMHRDLGIIYLREGKNLEALSELDQATDIMNTDGDTHFALGEVHSQLNNYRAAKDSYLKAVVINPDFAEAYYNLAEVYNRLGMREESKTSLSRSIELFSRQGRQDEAFVAREVFKKYFGRSR